MKDWIKQRIENLSEQLQEPECNNPSRVIAKKEAFEEMLYMIENKALAIADISPSLPSSEEFELALIKTPAEEPQLSSRTKHMSKRYTAGFYTGMKWAILLRQ